MPILVIQSFFILTHIKNNSKIYSRGFLRFKDWSVVMVFKIKNFGKIEYAEIKLDGITVICGNNNTGKSTVGKALFSFFNSLYDYKNKIQKEKINKARDFIVNYSSSVFNDIISFEENNDFFLRNESNYTIEEVKKYLEEKKAIKVSKDKIASLVNYLNSSESEIINEYVFRYFNSVMNGQLKNTYSSKNSECSVIGEFKEGTNIVSLSNKTSDCIIDEPLEHTAYYINSPFSLDWLNQGYFLLQGMNNLEKNVISAILKNQYDLNADSMTNILDSVLNKKDLDEVRNVIKNAYKGETKILNGKYYYHEGDVDFDFRNISAGLKSFALIERLLESGALKRKDVLILDEPEIHLHSEWQIIYAELIVILQKTFDLTILLVTHSFQFLESLEYFMRKYEIPERGNYYISTTNEKGTSITDGNSLSKMKKNLKSGMYTLADMKLSELYDGDSDEKDN